MPETPLPLQLAVARLLGTINAVQGELGPTLAALLIDRANAVATLTSNQPLTQHKD